MDEKERLEELDIDTALMVLENKLRRKILDYLSMEPHYPLQLAKKLGVSQQAVMKHLALLEKTGFVTHIPEEEGYHKGPPRKYYIPTRRLSLFIDVGHNLFRTELRAREEPLDMERREPDELVRSIKVLGPMEEKERLREMSEILQDLQVGIREKERERERLIQARDALLERAHDMIADRFMDYNRRLILYHLMCDGPTEVDALSEALNIRENIIRKIIKDMEEFMWL